MSESAAHTLIDILLDWGVRQVFTCPGSTEAPFLDASVDRPELDVCLTTHELTAVTMADGYARFAGGVPAVAYLHTNVGLVNGLGGMYAAQLGRAPVVVLNGLKAGVIQSRRGFTAPPDVGALAAGYAKWSWQAQRAEHLAQDLSRALQTATNGPPGPVWLGLPEDLVAAPASAVAPAPARSRRVAPGAPDPEQVTAAAAALAVARSPLLVAGADLVRENAVDLLVSLAEQLGARVVNEDRRSFERSAFPTGHPRYAGFYTERLPAVREADVVAFLGARCFHEFEAGSIAAPAAGVTLIHSNADPAEIGKTHGADITLTGDHRLILDRLMAALPAGHRPHPALPAPPAVTADPEPAGPLRVPEVAGALAATVDRRTRIVADATTSNAALFAHLPQEVPGQVITTSSGALGWGMGAALGVSVAKPSDRVVAVVGDGSFQFGAPALWVAARRRLPVTFLMINNGSYAAVAAALRRYGRRAVESGHYPGKDIAGPDFAAISAGYGVPAERVTSGPELARALDAAGDADGPRFIEVLTDPGDLGP
ncbi:thiamine pyrophosphate-binding protein [Micromonospora sp. WMMD975]|uniref:thiamine pyrophosphate-binding protein n=1 Tax=Micromonospora sp. WMMD975 TaxID=3016087 RepID=UPI002499BF09|nr:thiamine pyrophosphate-binding protein [Micromonospora sp. WMMD975]WFE34609.1 thiamine pyrophosphate-binding protein [Micromonospora sp. WMMD975]